MTVAKILETPSFSYLARAYRCKTVASIYITTKNVSKISTVACNSVATLFTVALHRVYI